MNDLYLHRKDKADIGDTEHNSPNQPSEESFGEIETEEMSSLLYKKLSPQYCEQCSLKRTI